MKDKVIEMLVRKLMQDSGYKYRVKEVTSIVYDENKKIGVKQCYIYFIDERNEKRCIALNEAIDYE